ncbi:MAG TPA: hypothetical protein VFY20_04165 [Gemmatimonadales bacterium]|nr:hypothetical protein [Gemmatimonadales bacterium]
MRRHAGLLLAVLLAACGSTQEALDPPTTGGLQVAITGLPDSTAAAVTVTGPGGFSRGLTAAGNLDDLVPGTYTVAAAQVTAASTVFEPSVASQSVQVAAGASRPVVTVTYASRAGRLAVLVSGLPGGTAAAVAVSGPGAFTRSLTASDTLEGLAPGAYTVSAANVTGAATTYQPGPATQQVSVASGALASASVAYGSGPAPATLDLFIDGMYVVQSVQSYGDTVPLVAGRDAVVRVFARASAANSVAPAVRLRLYQGASATPAQTWTVAAARPAVPTTIREDSLAWSWNQLVPGALLQPGVRLVADVDPTNAVAESDEANNTFPASGTAKTLDVRAVNPFAIRFVPVRTAGNNATGNVSSANRAQFLATFAKLYPVAAINSDVRTSVYTTTTRDTLQPNNGNGAWGAVLSEVGALRAADGFAGYYYGVVRAGYGSGTAGIGYVPGRTAVGWDRLPSGDGVAAHELGHNLSLSHAPCGGAGGADPGFPYAGGVAGIYGLDVASMTLKLPSLTDLMGYCNNTWISDFHYLKALNYRQANAAALVMGARVEPALLVWGRIVNGVVTLEPAFEITAPARLPSGRGAFALEALDAAGRSLYAASFDGELVADLGEDERHFAFVVPLARLGAGPARLQVRGGFAAAVRASRAALAAGAATDPAALRRQQPAPAAAASREGGDRVRLRWNADAYPMALVRDAATGEILSFARGGDAALVSGAASLDLTFSDGVQSRQERATVR